MRRIKNEHQDDACAIVNDRVKGSLKVTRAFGAGFLKQVYALIQWSWLPSLHGYIYREEYACTDVCWG